MWLPAKNRIQRGSLARLRCRQGRKVPGANSVLASKTRAATSDPILRAGRGHTFVPRRAPSQPSSRSPLACGVLPKIVHRMRARRLLCLTAVCARLMGGGRNRFCEGVQLPGADADPIADREAGEGVSNVYLRFHGGQHRWPRMIRHRINRPGLFPRRIFVV